MQSGANRCSGMDVSRRSRRHPIDVRHYVNPTRQSSATPQAIDHKGLR
jgi:hypothetical protein